MGKGILTICFLASSLRLRAARKILNFCNCFWRAFRFEWVHGKLSCLVNFEWLLIYFEISSFCSSMRAFSVCLLGLFFQPKSSLLRKLETGYHAGSDAILTRLRFDIIMNSISHFVHGHREHADGEQCASRSNDSHNGCKQRQTSSALWF